ncbi:MAG: Nif11-like leader peptide family natural product precursor [Acidobacteria bacterium]|nr:Nif11-like leader peptide family natural product precursor [Acidobacteriota bacterium]
MSIEAAKAFTEKVENDEELQAKVSEATSGRPEEGLAKVIEIGSGAGFEFNGEELRTATSELGDDELDAAAGGYEYKLERCLVKSWSIGG